MGPSEFTCTGTLKDYSRLDDLHRLDVPTLFLCGQFDEATPQTTALYRDKVASADLHVFENTSHSPHHERSAEFLQVVEAFLNRDVTPSR